MPETPPAETPVPDLSKHEQEFIMQKDDVPAVAALFNQVGSALTKVDSQQLADGHGKKALQLDKDRVIPTHLQPGSAQQASYQQPVMHHPPPEVLSPPPIPPPTSSSVTLGVKDYEKIEKLEKKVSTLQRKITTADKALTSIKESLDLPKTLPKYKITSSDIDCTTTNTQTLLGIVYKQLANRASDITISKC